MPDPHNPIPRSVHVKNSVTEVNLLAKGVNSDAKGVNFGQLLDLIIEFSIILLCMVVKCFIQHIPFQIFSENDISLEKPCRISFMGQVAVV